MDKQKIAQEAIAKTKPTFERMIDMTKSIFPVGQCFVLQFDGDDEIEESEGIFDRCTVIDYSINQKLNAISVQFEGESTGWSSIPLDYLLYRFKDAIQGYDPTE